MTPEQLKEMECWGSQNGLLSVAEIRELQKAITARSMFSTCRVMEIGHYMGLSTYALSQALEAWQKDTFGLWSLLTIDAHCKDAWVPESDPDQYFTNKAAYFDNALITTLIARSESIIRIDGIDVVFYDGDHGDEQKRFTEVVVASPSVQMFIYDDCDFAVPMQCSELLATAGWRNESPVTRRLEGDKRNPNTCTLAVWHR